MPQNDCVLGKKPWVFLVEYRKPLGHQCGSKYTAVIRWCLARGPGTPSPVLQVPRGDSSAQRTLSTVSLCNRGSRNPPGPQRSMARPDLKVPFPGPHSALNFYHSHCEKRPGHCMLPQGQAAPGCSFQASWEQGSGPMTWKEELVLKFVGLVLGCPSNLDANRCAAYMCVLG